MAMTYEQKGEFSNEAQKALDHPLFQGALDEACFNLGLRSDDFKALALKKLALYAAIVARAQALGLDPEMLRLTSEEESEVHLEIMTGTVPRRADP